MIVNYSSMIDNYRIKDLEYIWMKSRINDAWDKNKGNKLIVNCK